LYQINKNINWYASTLINYVFSCICTCIENFGYDWYFRESIAFRTHLFDYLFCRCYLGVELLKSNNEGNESLLKSLWHHSDAILCCTLKVCPQIISMSKYMRLFSVSCISLSTWFNSVGFWTECLIFLSWKDVQLFEL